MASSDPLLKFVAHKHNCDYLQPMWHQGPCDCGLYEAMDSLHQLYGDEVFTHVRPELIQDWREDRARKAKRSVNT